MIFGFRLLTRAFMTSTLTKTAPTSQPPNEGKTALDEYVWAEDKNYGWIELEDHEIHGKGLLHFNKGWTGYTLNVTSQQWLTPEDFF